MCAALDRRKANGFFRYAQIFGAAAMSFMHGAQDGQKFIGVLFLGLAFCNGQTSVSGVVIPVWLMLLCSTVMGVGTSVGGEKIIKSVGMDMVRLEKYQGFAADLSAAACLLLSSLFGIPVSTTHTKTSAIMGVGAVKRLSAINYGVVKDMMLTWVFTFPGCGLISFAMAKLFMCDLLAAGKCPAAGYRSVPAATKREEKRSWRKYRIPTISTPSRACAEDACQCRPSAGGR